MLIEQIIFGLTGTVLFVIGLRGTLLHASMLARIIALNVTGAGVFLIFVSIAFQGDGQTADPIPHALVLTGIVVAVSATALALALNRRLREIRDE